MSAQIEHHPDTTQTLETHWENVAHALDWFSQAMEDKFAAVAHKGHWYYVDWPYLYERICTEMAELHEAATTPGTESQAMIDECIDVANCALMLADWLRFMRGDLPDA